MNIYINNDKIDFQLESEKVLAEVVNALSGWASGEGYHIISVSYDGSLYDFRNEECKNKPVEEVDTVKIEVKSQIELLLENIQLLHQFFSLFEKALNAGNYTLLHELQNESEMPERLLKEIIGGFQTDLNDGHPDLFTMMKTYSPENQESTETQDYILGRVKSILIILNDRIRELTDSLNEFSAVIKVLRVSLEDINNISILLQTGKDRDALTGIIRFTELTQKLLRIYTILENTGVFDFSSAVIDEMSIRDYFTSLNEILNEFTEAFSVGDSVLVGDLLEYEISPRVSSLLDVLEQYIKKE